MNSGDERPSGLSHGMRLAAMMAVLLAAIVVPFLIWGEDLERLAPAMLAQQNTRLVIAGLGAALLIADVLLPVPSSVVSALLCVMLGPMLGGLAILCGMCGGFVCGYFLGRLVPGDSLRRWVGPALWDSVRGRAARESMTWIVVSRPVPVLAEAVSIISGSLAVPLRPALLAAILSSAGVAACYAAAASLGNANGSFWLSFAVSILLASAVWLVSHFWRGRLRARDDRGEPG